MDIEQIPISPEVLAIMRDAVARSRVRGENFISSRTLMLALAHEPSLQEHLAEVIDVERLEGLIFEPVELPGIAHVPDERLEEGEDAPFPKYDTLAFKSPDGATSMWLNGETHAVFLEGARHAADAERYLPKHLALGFVSESRRTPAVLTSIKIDAAALSKAVFEL